MTTTANVNDRASVESVYPLDAYRRDASRNLIQNASVLHGLTIGSPPDETGTFDVRQSERQTGEQDRTPDAAFVPAFVSNDPGQYEADYGTFIERILELARSALRPPDGGDERLQGFHGG